MNTQQDSRLDRPWYSMTILLLVPLTTEESTPKAVFQPPKLPKPAEDKASDSETPVSQVTPLLGTTPRENHQLQHRNTPDDILTS